MRTEKGIVFFVSLMLLAVAVFPVAALDCGAKAPKLQVADWVRNGPVELTESNESKTLTVVDFWATWCPPCRQIVPLLCDIQAKYRDRGVVIVGVTREGKAVVDAYLAEIGDINYAVGLDDQGRTTAAYMAQETSIPYLFVIDGQGRVAWKGHPINLERVLARMVAGTFDAKTEEKIVKARDRLQQAFQTANESEIERAGDELLKLDPEDAVALQMRLFVFERRNQLPQALTFLDGRIAVSPQFAPLFFLKLDLLSKSNASPDSIRACAEQVFERFQNDASTMEALARMLAYDLPFGVAPADIAVRAAETAFEKLPENADALQRTACHETLAKAYHGVGRLDKAIGAQNLALEHAKATPRKADVERILEWYRAASAFGEKP